MRCVHDWKAGPEYDCNDCMEHVGEEAKKMAKPLTRNEDDALDVASEAVLFILAKRQFDPRRGFRFTTYLRVVVTTAAAAFYRALSREDRTTAAIGPLTINVRRSPGGRWAEPLDAEAAIRTAELAVMLSDILDLLEPENREAFCLRLAGYSRVEIARRVPVDGTYLTPQAWSQRLVPIEEAIVEALQLKKPLSS